MKIYLASSWKNVMLVRDFAECLRERGYEVDDFTDDSNGRFSFSFNKLPEIEKHNAISVLKFPEVQQAFTEDKKWIDWSDCVLMILPCGKSAHLEAGYAKGQGKKLIIYQKHYPLGEFDVMYGFADLVTNDYMEIIGFIQSIET
jgi:nucleoside 2-deoxyribosyltransferase